MGGAPVLELPRGYQANGPLGCRDKGRGRNSVLLGVEAQPSQAPPLLGPPGRLALPGLGCQYPGGLLPRATPTEPHNP